MRPAIFLSLLTLASSAPPDEPIRLVTDVGCHTARVNEVVFSPDGKELFSVSDDKTVRVWDVETGETVRVLRSQPGPGPEGRLYAAALSPRGDLLIVGGWSPKDAGLVRLLDPRTGESRGLWKGHSDAVLRLAFSPKGDLAVSGSADGTARVWDVTTGKTLQVLAGHDGRVEGAAFSPDGRRVATGSDDGRVRLWELGQEKPISSRKKHGKPVKAVAFTPDGKHLVSAGFDSTLRLWDGRTGQPLKALAENVGFVEHLSVAEVGGRTLALAGARRNSVAVDLPSGEIVFGQYADQSLPTLAVVAPASRLVAGTHGENGIWLRELASGKDERALPATMDDMNVGFGRDGRAIVWGERLAFPIGRRQGASTRQFQLLAGAVESWDEVDRAILKTGEVELRAPGERERPTLQILRAGRVVHKITRDETNGFEHLSFTLTPGGNVAVSGGGDGELSSYDTSTGRKLATFEGHTGGVRAVAPSPDGRWLLSASDDQTVRLWELATGKLLLTILKPRPGEWAAWTPEGYYASSPRADRYFGWQVNRGLHEAAEYYPASLFQPQFFRPDLVAAHLEAAGDPDKARTAGEGRAVPDIVAFRAPRVAITEPSKDGRTVTERRVPFRASVSSELPLTEVQVLRNDALLGRLTPGKGVGESPTEWSIDLPDVPLEAGQNTFSVVAFHEKASSGAVTRSVVCAPGDAEPPPDLYVLVAGVEYPHPSAPLSYRNRDELSLRQAFLALKGHPYGEVTVETLPDETAGKGSSKEEVSKALSRFGAAATDRDLCVLFLAPGAMDESSFAPSEREGKRDPGVRGIPWDELRERFLALKGKRLLLISTVYGTERFDPGTWKPWKDLAFRVPGLTILAGASPAKAMSHSDAPWGHGAFTEGLFAGLCVADRRIAQSYATRPNHAVEVDELCRWMSGYGACYGTAGRLVVSEALEGANPQFCRLVRFDDTCGDEDP